MNIRAHVDVANGQCSHVEIQLYVLYPLFVNPRRNKQPINIV